MLAVLFLDKKTLDTGRCAHLSLEGLKTYRLPQIPRGFESIARISSRPYEKRPLTYFKILKEYQVL